MPRVNDREVVRITRANPGLGEDLRSRQRRYLVSMAVRTVAFVAAVALLRGWARWLGVAVAVVLPWFAVVIANVGRGSRVAAPLQQGSDPARTLTAGGPEPARPTVTVPGTVRTANGDSASGFTVRQSPDGAMTESPDGEMTESPDGAMTGSSDGEVGQSPDGEVTGTALVDTPQGPVHLTGSRRN